eukprot:Sspe_Gene.101232::Locus_75829_Transcript_1_1_Confidence_1.000_Length_636::g.101232::m.101232
MSRRNGGMLSPNVSPSDLAEWRASRSRDLEVDALGRRSCPTNPSAPASANISPARGARPSGDASSLPRSSKSNHPAAEPADRSVPLTSLSVTLSGTCSSCGAPKELWRHSIPDQPRPAPPTPPVVHRQVMTPDQVEKSVWSTPTHPTSPPTSPSQVLELASLREEVKELKGLLTAVLQKATPPPGALPP